VSRERIFEDSYEIVTNLDAMTLTRRLMVEFAGEDGLDYGGMSREWFLALTEEFFNPTRHLFSKHSKGYYYEVNKHSRANPQHLTDFTFVGMVLGMAIYHAKLFHGHFGLPFYKALLGRPLSLDDLRHIDVELHQSLAKVEVATDVTDWDLNFTISDTNEQGKSVEVELKPGGAQLPVTNENKQEFLDLAVRHFEKSIVDQVTAIKLGLHLFVPEALLAEFEPTEIDQLIGGVEPSVDDLKTHADYAEPLTDSAPLVKQFWEITATFDEEELKRLVRFVTGTDKVPIGGFAHLVGSSGTQPFTIAPKKTGGLPTAHTCFNRLELPAYADSNQMRKELLIAISEYAGFGIQ